MEDAQFWKRVDRSGNCWVWLGATNGKGYGRLQRGSTWHYAHRYAFLLEHGWLPDVVMHACDNRPCVRPSHLQAGTVAENNRDCRIKGRDRNPRGVAHGQAKLTEAAVRAIRRTESSQREIAQAFGVTRSTVGRILRGEAWTHVK